jgi:hypothetical protein
MDGIANQCVNAQQHSPTVCCHQGKRSKTDDSRDCVVNRNEENMIVVFP